VYKMVQNMLDKCIYTNICGRGQDGEVRARSDQALGKQALGNQALRRLGNRRSGLRQPEEIPECSRFD
jgi:hypothetical protein